MDIMFTENAKWRYQEQEVPQFAIVDRDVVSSGWRSTTTLAALESTVIHLPAYSHDVKLKGNTLDTVYPNAGDHPVHSFYIDGEKHPDTASTFSLISKWKFPSFMTRWFTDYATVFVSVDISLRGVCRYEDVAVTVDVSGWLQDAALSQVSQFSGQGTTWSGLLKFIGGYIDTAEIPTIKFGMGGLVHAVAYPDRQEALYTRVTVIACNSFEDVAAD